VPFGFAGLYGVAAMSLEKVGARRWERRRQLLPKLKLKCPTASKSRTLSRLAGVDGPAIFRRHLQSIILDAHLNDVALKGLSEPEVRRALNKVATACKNLRGALSAIDIGTGGSAERAGFLLEMELGSDGFCEHPELIPDCLELLDRVNNAARKAAERTKSKRGPKGTAGTPAFGSFIESLQMAAWQRRGNWTISRKADGSWTGTFLQAIEILKPYLPADFLPHGELGRAVEHIRKKLKDHTTKNRSST
jgi:hypothetical protein